MNGPSIWDYLPQPNRDCIPARESGRPAGLYRLLDFYNRDGSVSFGTETREYFGTLAAEIARASDRSMTVVIVGLGAEMTFTQGQTGLTALEGRHRLFDSQQSRRARSGGWR